MGSGDTHKVILTPMNADHKRRDNKQSALSAGLSSLPVATSVVAAGVLAFLSGGYMLGLSAPAVVVFLVAAAACVWLVREWSRPSPLFLGALVSLAAFAFWTGLSVLWSFGPDLTWVGFNVTALYLAVLAIVGLSPAPASWLSASRWLPTRFSARRFRMWSRTLTSTRGSRARSATGTRSPCS